MISLILLHHLILTTLAFSRLVVRIRHHHLLFHLLGGHLLLLLLLSCDRGRDPLSRRGSRVALLILLRGRLHRLAVELGGRLRGTLLLNDWDYLSPPGRGLLQLLQYLLLHRCEV